MEEERGNGTYGDEAEDTRQAVPLRSFFTKRLEVKIEERGMDLPYTFIALMDVPFEDFTPEQDAFYQTEFKLYTYFFIEIIIDLYEALGSHREGWEDMLGRLPDTPIKELVAQSLHEKARLEGFDDGMGEEAPADPFDLMEMGQPLTLTVDKKVIRTTPAEEQRKGGRWWEKKVF
jgi:hypothetical protein